MASALQELRNIEGGLHIIYKTGRPTPNFESRQSKKGTLTLKNRYRQSNFRTVLAILKRSIMYRISFKASLHYFYL